MPQANVGTSSSSIDTGDIARAGGEGAASGPSAGSADSSGHDDSSRDSSVMVGSPNSGKFGGSVGVQGLMKSVIASVSAAGSAAAAHAAAAASMTRPAAAAAESSGGSNSITPSGNQHIADASRL